MARIRHPWSEIQCFYDDGQSAKECRARFAFSVQSWYKAVRFGRMVLREGDVRLMRSRGPGNYQYDWQAVQRYYDEGHTYRECSAHFGFGPDSWTDARRRGALRARARALTGMATSRPSWYRSTVKRRLLQEGILQNRCDECGLMEWRGRPISIQIDHRNGIRDDHRFENRRMLCPNCHSQTETFGARNKRKIDPR